MKDTFTDEKGYHYARVLAMQKKITAGAFLQFCVLRDMAGKKRHCWPTEEELAAMMGCCRQTVSERNMKLAAFGLFEMRLELWGMAWRNNYYFKDDYTADFEAINPNTKEKPTPAPKSSPESKPEAITPPPQTEPKRPLTDDERATSVFGILQRKFDGKEPLMLDCLFRNEGKIKAKHGLAVYEKIRARLPATVGTS